MKKTSLRHRLAAAWIERFLRSNDVVDTIEEKFEEPLEKRHISVEERKRLAKFLKKSGS